MEPDMTIAWATYPLTDKGTLQRAEHLGLFTDILLTDAGALYYWEGQMWTRHDYGQCVMTLVVAVSDRLEGERRIAHSNFLENYVASHDIHIEGTITKTAIERMITNAEKTHLNDAIKKIDRNYEAYFKRLQSYTGIHEATKLLMKKNELIRVEEENMNARHGYINLKDGIYNVKTGEVIPHQRDFYFTGMLPYDSSEIPNLYGSDVAQTYEHFCTHAPKFASVLANLADRDEDYAERDSIVHYLLAIIGIALSGENKDRLVPILKGETGTGKGLYHAVIAKLMPDAYAEIPSGTFLSSGSVSTSAKETSMARMRGKLFVATSEFPANSRLAMDAIKALSGFDPLTGRWMRGNAFTFRFWGLYMARTNKMPHLGEYDAAVRERIRVIEVFKTVAKEDRKFRYEDEIASEEGAIILGVAIRFMLLYNARTLSEPTSITESTDTVFSDDNRVGRVAKRYLSLSEGDILRSGELTKMLKFMMKNDEEGGHEKLTVAVLEEHLSSAFGTAIEVGKKKDGYPVVRGLTLNMDAIEDSGVIDELSGVLRGTQIAKNYSIRSHFFPHAVDN